MRTLACVVFVLYLGWTGTAVAEGGAGTGLSRSALVTFRPYYHHHHHYVQHLEKTIVSSRVSKAKHHHLRPSGYAEDLTPRRNVSSETSITQMPIDKTYALSLGHRCSASTREALARGNCSVKCCLLSSQQACPVCKVPCFEVYLQDR